MGDFVKHIIDPTFKLKPSRENAVLESLKALTNLFSWSYGICGDHHGDRFTRFFGIIIDE